MPIRRWSWACWIRRGAGFFAGHMSALLQAFPYALIQELAASENLLLPPQVAERPDVRDDQRDPKLIFSADVAQREPLVPHRQPAARTVVAHLRQLVLRQILPQVVA